MQIAAKHGWKHPRWSKNVSYQFAREFLSYKYVFIYNLAKQIITYTEKPASNSKDFDDRDLNSIYQRILTEESIKIGIKDLEIILFSDFVPEFDPIWDYFENLPAHDGYDYIGELASTIIPELNFAAIWPVYLKKWLLGLVAGVIRDADINQSALILHGEQGVGKSRWINRLVPVELQDYYYTGKINANNKDSKLMAYQNLLINLDELDFPERKEINSLKSLITQKITKERFQYRKFAVTIKKRSSFIGSVNRKEFLNDPTGNRRFLCITAMEINADHNIDMKRVYAQAKHLLLSGEAHWFTFEQNKEISMNSLEFSYTTMEEEVIAEKFAPCKHDDDDARFLSTTEINRELFPDHIDNSVRNRIGQALTKLGFIKRNKFINGSSRSVWVIKNKSSISYAIKETEDLPF
ncbi:MAG: virulence-associated E family protein [Stygiobacter sp.]|nr:MAG: virulence-associated E family protein [Stygiobacter sp.]